VAGEKIRDGRHHRDSYKEGRLLLFIRIEAPDGDIAGQPGGSTAMP